MFALVLVGALIAQSALAAPQTGCVGPCSASQQQQIGGHGGYERKSSWSSYSKWSSGGNGRYNNGGGSTLGNLENFDENGIFGGVERPGNWQEEKNFVTNDGTGKIDVKAGRTETNNGYSKFAEHSWQFDSRQGTFANHGNAQIISSADFQNKIQGIRSEIDRFMGEFNIDSNFRVDQGVLDSFKIRSGILENQVNNFCNGFDVNSKFYQQAQSMRDKFHHDCEQIQRQMESMIYHHNGGNVNSETHGTYAYRPSTSHYSAPQYAAPTTPRIDFEERRINEECNQVQSEIQNFYNKFNAVNYQTLDREDSLNQFKHEADSQMLALNQKLANLQVEATNHEASRQSIENMISQFQAYQQDIEKRVQEVQIKIQEEQRRIREKIHRRQREEIERQESEHRKILAELDAQKNQAAERERRLQEERAKIEQEAIAEQHRLEQISREKQELEIKQRQEIATAATVTVTGRPAAQIQQVDLGPHLDVRAITERLNQELHRLQTQVTSFNSYIMQLTVSNHHKITLEAQRRAQQLRQNLNSLCEQSNQYNNSQIENSAEQIKTQFEQIWQQFQREAAQMAAQASSAHASGNFESGSQWQQSGRVSQIRAPTLTNIDYQHTKQTDVEVFNRPQNSQRYVQPEGVECVEMHAGQPCIQPTRYRRDVGGYGPYEENTIQQRRPENYGYRHNNNEYSRNDLENNSQHSESVYVPSDPLRDDHQRQSRQRGRGFYLLDVSNPDVMKDYLAIKKPNIEINPENSKYLKKQSQGTDLNQQRVYDAKQDDLDPLQKLQNKISQPMNLGNSKENISQQQLNYELDENLESSQNPRNQINRVSSHNRDTELKRSNQNLSQRRADFGRNEEYESLEKPVVQTFDARHKRIQTPRLRNLDSEDDEIQDENQQPKIIETNDSNDNSRQNSESVQQSGSNNEQSVEPKYEHPNQQINIVSVEDDTSENNHYNDQVEVTEDSHIIPVSTPKTVEKHQSHENTPENSGFHNKNAKHNQQFQHNQQLQNERFDTYNNGQLEDDDQRKNQHMYIQNNDQLVQYKQHENQRSNAYDNGQHKEDEHLESQHFNTHANSQAVEDEQRENIRLNDYNNGQRENQYLNTHNNRQPVQYEQYENQNFNTYANGQREEDKQQENQRVNTHVNGQVVEDEQREILHSDNYNNGQRENQYFNTHNNDQLVKHEQHENQRLNTHANGQTVDDEQRKILHSDNYNNGQRKNQHSNTDNNNKSVEYEQRENVHINTYNNGQRLEHEQRENNNFNIHDNSRLNTLENSGFYDQNTRQNQQKQNNHFNTYNYDTRVENDERESHHLNTHNSNLHIDHGHRKNEDNLSQQTAGQINVDRDNQSGRSSQFGRVDNNYDDFQQRPFSRTYYEHNRKNEHPTGQYIDTISQHHEQVVPKIYENDQNQYSHQVEHDKEYSDKSFLKPILRISRPSHVDHIQNVPRNVEIVDLSTVVGNDNVEQPINTQDNDSGRRPGSYRGDIPGYTSIIPGLSKPTFTLPPVKHTTLVPPTVIYPKPPQIISSLAPPIYKPKCYGNQPISICNGNYKWHFNRTIEYNKQWNNNRFSHNSNYFNQDHFQTGQQVQNPHGQIQLTPGYRHEQRNNLKFQQGIHSNPSQHNQGCFFNCYTQLPTFSQQSHHNLHQTRYPSFENYSNFQRQSSITLGHETGQTTIDDIAQSVIPLGGTRPVNTWTEAFTTPRTFGQRTGQKLSQHSYEGVRTIFG